MWITGLGGLYFSAFQHDAGNTQLFGFDNTLGGFDRIPTSQGSDFIPYSDVFEIFGKQMVSGRAVGAEGDAYGYELYEFTSDGTLTLFSDIVAGPDSSFFDLDHLVPGMIEDGRALATFGGVYAIPAFIYEDGSASLFADEIPELDDITKFNQAKLYDDGFVFSYQSDPNISSSYRSYYYDFQTGIAEELNTFDRPMHPSFAVKNHWVIEGRLFAEIHGWLDDGVTRILGLWELKDGVWTYLTQAGSDLSMTGAGSAFAYNGDIYFGGTAYPYGRELYKITDTGFEIAADFWPNSTANSFLTLGHFFFGEDVYLAITSHVYLESGRYEGWFRMSPDGTLSTVESIGPDELPPPSYIIDVDHGTYGGSYSNGSTPNHVHIIENGQIRMLEVPGTEVSLLGFHGGTFYVSAANEEGDAQLFALADSTWVNVLKGFEQTEGLDLSRFVSMSALQDAPDVWFGDDTAEHIVTGTSGGVIHAHGGDDTIEGSQTDDVIHAGAGADTVHSGSGSDYVRSAEGADEIHLSGTEVFGQGTYAFNISSDFQTGTHAKVSVAGRVRIEDVVDGGAGIDTIVLTPEDDSLFLHDAISAFSSAVVLEADYAGRNSHARFSEIEIIDAGEGNDIIDLTSPDYSLAGQQISIHGGAGNDMVWGSDADETIFGDDGDDTLFGGAGENVLSGGLGADVFEFTRTSTQTQLADFAIDENDILRFFNTGGARFDDASLTQTQTGISIGYRETGSQILQIIEIDALALAYSSGVSVEEIYQNVEIIG